MNILIIYDSVFGNTEKVAQAICANARAELLPVSQVTTDNLGELDVLIVGSPTRGFRPTEDISQFLKVLPNKGLAGIGVAAFDTRIDLDTIDSSVFRFIVDKGGYAASTIAKALEKKGGKLLAPPEGFLVTGEQGPLKEGELERAGAWTESLFAKE